MKLSSVHDRRVDALADFLSQMHLAALEESPLYEIPRGSTDLVRGTPVVHGPWPAQSCAAVLNIWYALGWIGLYYPEPPPGWNVEPAEWSARLVDGQVLSQADGQTLLGHRERWLVGQADGHVCLYCTETGEATPWQLWHDMALEAAQRLPIIERKD